MRKILFIILIVAILIAGLGIFTLVKITPAPKKQVTDKSTPNSSLEAPAFHSDHPIAQADEVMPHHSPPEATPTPTPSPAEPTPTPKRLAPLRIYTSTETPSPTPKEENVGDYAPSFRLVRCKLVNTIDSSNITTPIIGLVTDDLVWNGKVIIPKCSEVHGIAQVDKSRERIASEGAWTFVLHDEDNPGEGREIVLKGIALDREDDPEFKKLMVGASAVDSVPKTWGITDGGAGLRGVVIRTNNASALQLFVATFIAGLAKLPGEVASGIGTGLAGGALITPATQASQDALDRYSQMVLEAIERDGFFIRVPAAKLFYVYVTEDILTGRATIGGARRLHEVQSEFLKDRSIQEDVTEARATRDEQKAEIAKNPYGYSIDPNLQKHLENENNAIEMEKQRLQNQVDQLDKKVHSGDTP